MPRFDEGLADGVFSQVDFDAVDGDGFFSERDIDGGKASKIFLSRARQYQLQLLER